MYEGMTHQEYPMDDGEEIPVDEIPANGGVASAELILNGHGD